MPYINDLLKEMKVAYLVEQPGNEEEARASVVRSTSRKIIDEMKGDAKQRLRQKKLRKSLKNPVTRGENPSQRELTQAVGGYNVWGATGLNGDGYALAEPNDGTDATAMSEGKEKKCPRCLVKKAACRCLSNRTLHVNLTTPPELQVLMADTTRTTTLQPHLLTTRDTIKTTT